MKKMSRILAFIMCFVMVFSVTSVGASALVIRPMRPSKVTASSTAATVTLSWTKVTRATGYRVYRYVNNNWKAIKTTSDTTYKVTGLAASSTYNFAVKSYRKSGDEIAWSDYRSLSVNTKSMGKIATIKTAVNTKAVKLSWSAVEGASGYRVYQYKGGKWTALKTVGASTRTYLISSLKSGTTYSFAVKPYARSTSGIVWGTTKTVKATTTSVNKAKFSSYTAATNAITLKWGKLSGVSGYRIYQYKSGEYKAIKTTAGTSYKVTGLKSNTNYYFKVRAYKNNNGKITWYAYSDAVKIKTLALSSELGVYRVAKYQKIFNAGTYKMTFVTNDKELGNTPITVAVRNGYLYIETEIEGLKTKLIYNNKNGKTYMLLDDFKKYTIITEELMGEDIDISASIAEYAKMNIGSKITSSYATIGGKKVVCEKYKDSVTGDTIKYYFNNDVIYAQDTVDASTGKVSRILYKSFTTDVPSSLFAVPKNYAYINLSWLGSLM